MMKGQYFIHQNLQKGFISLDGDSNGDFFFITGNYEKREYQFSELIYIFRRYLFVHQMYGDGNIAINDGGGQCLKKNVVVEV